MGRGVPQIEVTFDIDANGILSVTAKDKGSGKEQSISITGASTLSDNEVDKMVKDAETNASSDKEKRERIDLKNQSETLVYQTEKQKRKRTKKKTHVKRRDSEKHKQVIGKKKIMS